jgi:predicted MFS family arabinose efflux permease
MTFDRPRCAVTAAGFCAFLDLYAPQAVLPQLAETFHISPAAAGTTVGISTLAVAVSAPFVGLLSDRVGHKPTVVAAALLLTIPTVMLMLAGSFTEILVWRFVQGMFLPAIFACTVAYVSEEWSPAEAADVMGLYIAGSALGGFSGRFVTALMADAFGWRAGFGVLTLFTLAGAAMIWGWLPAAQHKPKGHIAAPGFATVIEHLRNPALLATFVAGFAVLFSMVAAFTYVNFHLSLPPFSLSTPQLGMIFLVYPIGAVVSTRSGAIIRRLGRRWAMMLAVATSCVGLLTTLSPNLSVILAGLALFVIGVFLAQSAAMGYVGQAARHAKSTALGLYVCFYYIGGSFGAVVPGWLWLHTGWLGCVLLILATMGASALLTWQAWKPTKVVCPAE